MFGGAVERPGHPHVGIAYLISWLKKNNVEVDLYDDGLQYNNEKLERKIKDSNADLIGITMFSYCYQSGYDIINLIKNITRTPLVVGGAHVSSTKNQILEETEADFAIKHEGEKTLLELLEYVSKNIKSYENIDGLIWKRDGEIIENNDRKFLTSEELDGLPFPDYEAFDLGEYLCYQTRTLPIITSRGCPYQCNYCSVKLSMGRGFRYRSAENVFNELRYWYEKGWSRFEINDDCFTMNMKRANEICDNIIKSGIKIKFSLYNGIRVDRIDRVLLSKMKKAGCIFLSFGCESGNNDILKKIKKGITTHQVIQASKWAYSLGISHSVNFIIGHTGETFETALDSINLAKKLPCNFVNFYNLIPYPNTAAFEWAKENGKFLVNENDYLKLVSYRDNVPIFETVQFTKEERMKITKIGFDLYERKVLEFRFGKAMGLVVFYLTRSPIIHKIAIKLIGFKFGWRFFVFLSRKSRN